MFSGFHWIILCYVAIVIDPIQWLYEYSDANIPMNVS